MNGLEGICKLPKVWKPIQSDLKERAIHKTRLLLDWSLRLVYSSGVETAQAQLTIIHQQDHLSPQSPSRFFRGQGEGWAGIFFYFLDPPVSGWAAR